jgi:hypothetical protein
MQRVVNSSMARVEQQREIDQLLLLAAQGAAHGEQRRRRLERGAVPPCTQHDEDAQHEVDQLRAASSLEDRPVRISA